MIKQEENLLNRIYRDTKMGEENIATVLRTLEDTALRRELITEMEGYASLNTRAKKALYERRAFPAEQPFLEKMMSGAMIRMRTSMLRDPKDVARMMIKGNRVGINAARKELGRCRSHTSAACVLAKDAIAFEEENIRRLRASL